MKSKKVAELLKRIEEQVEDLNPLNEYRPITPLIEIAELEMENSLLLEEKIKEFKQEHLLLFQKEMRVNLKIDTILHNTLEKSSKEKPFKIPVEIDEFVEIEYELIEANMFKSNNFYEWKIYKQSLKTDKGKKIDIIEIIYKRTAKQKEYSKKTFYFDITDNFKIKYDDKNQLIKAINSPINLRK